MFAVRARLLIATLWVGSMWTIGYLVASTLFAMLPDKILAGTIAGRLFQIEAWLTVFCALALIGLLRLSRKNRSDKSGTPLLWLVAAMFACTLLGYFGLHPFMAALRDAAGPGGVMDSDARTEFGILHGISSILYLMQSLLGVVLVLKVR
jgi:hypothetical protein